MRLLHTTDLTLRSFNGDIPKYAILSHTWVEDQEVGYKELMKRRNLTKTGWAKIQNFCKLVASKGYDWCWVDTCCIDKSSSAELQEAINSMFKYYKGSGLCIAYLADVPAAGASCGEEEWLNWFKTSRWFTRAWTLQELLAPNDVHFWDHEWTAEQGTKQSLCESISEVTQINLRALVYFDPPKFHAVHILSWAAKRQCSRPEDQAYALMGLLNINMPLLYGEGSQALQRLQQEIFNGNDDESVLLWRLPPYAPAGHQYALFAPSILYFADGARDVSGYMPPVYPASEGSKACLLCNESFINDDYMRAHFQGCIMRHVKARRPLMLSSRGLHARRPMFRILKFEDGEDAFFIPLEVLRKRQLGE